MTDLLWRVTADCPLRNPEVRGGQYCGAYFLDLCER
jgi:hypothetical protein